MRSSPVTPPNVAVKPLARRLVQTRVSVAPTVVGAFALMIASASEPPVTERCGPDASPTVSVGFVSANVMSVEATVAPAICTDTSRSVRSKCVEPVTNPASAIVASPARCSEIDASMLKAGTPPTPERPDQSRRGASAPAAVFAWFN